MARIHPKGFFKCFVIWLLMTLDTFSLSLRWHRATGENRPTSLWESWMIFTWCQIRPLGDLFPPFTILICLSFTDRFWFVGCVTCLLLFLSLLLYWGRSDAGTVPWKVCKLIFGSCQKTPEFCMAGVKILRYSKSLLYVLIWKRM